MPFKKTKEESGYIRLSASERFGLLPDDPAVATIEAVKNSADKAVMYKDLRPIRDFKHLITTSAALYGERTAFMERFEKGEPFKEITYNEALCDINALGTALVDLGLKGGHIALVGDNGYHWAISYLAITAGTGVAVPLDRELSKGDFLQLVTEAEASAVICSERFVKCFSEIKENGNTGLEYIISMNGESRPGILSEKELMEKGRALLASGDARFTKAEIDPDAMSVLLYTSGTTGIAKGVMLSQRNICSDVMIAPSLMNIRPTDIFFSVLPMHHVYECSCGFLTPLYAGAAIAYCEGLKYIAKNLKEIRPTVFLAVPLIFENLYKTITKQLRKSGKESLVRNVLKVDKITSKVGIDIKRKLLSQIYAVFGDRMRIFISGGAAIDPAILDFFTSLGYIAVQGYGLTECSPMVSLNPDDPRYTRNKSVGHILPTLEIKIENPIDGIGEICVKGSNVMLGYRGMPEESKRALEGGFFRTGDLGYVDSDGYIYITGRAKSVIITGNGKNVFPEELEYLLGKSPFISESMVWAGKDGEGRDSVITATVKPDFEELEAVLGSKISDDAAVSEIINREVDKLNEDLPLFKKIRRVVIRRRDFDKTSGRKIKRYVGENKN